MRVLSVGNMYPPHHLGGYELMWRSAVGDLRDGGHEVRVLTTDYRNADGADGAGEDPDVHRELRWYWHEHELPRLGLRERLALERHNLDVLDRHLRELRPEVVNWWAMGGMSMSLIEAVRRAELPALGVVVDHWLVYGPQADGWQRAGSRLGPLAGALERLAGVPARVDLAGAASWLFVSDSLRRRALEAGLELPRTEVAYGGIDRALFPAAPEAPWRWRLLYLGRIDRRKGIETAVRALASLPEEASLTVLGSGDAAYLRRLHALVAELGLDGRVRFTRRPRAELGAAYAEADAVLFPVIWEEPWGLVPLEAMSVGTPVIATGTGGSGEYLRDGDNCLLFRPRDDPEALAAAARRLAADEGLRRRLRVGGLETAERFGEGSFNAAVAQALERVAGEGVGGREQAGVGA